MQLVYGKLSGDVTSKLYVERRGGFELLRSEDWPPVVQGESPRVLVTLRAWPMRG